MNKKTLLLTIALITIPILAYVWIQKNDGRESITNARREPITIVYHASYERLLIDELITESDLIVIGNLKTIHAGRWNTSDGKRPEGDLAQGIKPGNHIFTDMDFDVAQLLKGDTQQKNVRIRSLGGIVEGDRMVADKIIPDMDKTYLLFLDLGRAGSTNNIVTGHYWITGGGFQGMYEIVGDKAISKVDEWDINELIAYIQKSLSTEVPSSTLTPTPTELLIETPTPSPAPIELSTEIPLPTETVSPTP